MERRLRLQGQTEHIEVAIWVACRGTMQKTVASSDEVKYKKGIEYRVLEARQRIYRAADGHSYESRVGQQQRGGDLPAAGNPRPGIQEGGSCRCICIDGWGPGTQREEEI